ncbi:MAG TPA: endonuclease/exonuclease/phosphatase family protein [Chthoniobacterales bacterium]|jgi:endonuclease/exonuclease/phosphatase family metal-dependent hydrolase
MKYLFFAVLTFVLSLGARAETPEQVRFMVYNVQNYVRMNRAIEGKQVANAPKPENEIEALISIIAAEKPDIIGVSEMGAPAEFEDFLARLKRAGLDYPHTEHVVAYDQERHLALASRFPISARDSQKNLSFDLNGKKQYYKRGILDVTIDVSPAFQLRFLGTHLKSKREVPEDQALLRRAEAHLLRLHAKNILEKAPDTKLLLYGDLNDTINEAPIREIMGSNKMPDYLSPIYLADDDNEKWTHFWKVADIYSRIDYVFASRAALKHLNREKTHIASPKNWLQASDHRPLVVVLRVNP